MIGWTTNQHGRGSYSALKVEILHRDYDGVYDRTKVFLNTRLMAVRVQLERSILNGFRLLTQNLL